MSVVAIRQAVSEQLEAAGYRPVKDAVRPEQVSSGLADRSFTVEVLRLRRAEEAKDANDVLYYEGRLRIWILHRLNPSDVPADLDRAALDLEAILAHLLSPLSRPSEAVEMDVVEAVMAPLQEGSAGLMTVIDLETLYRVTRR